MLLVHAGLHPAWGDPVTRLSKLDPKPRFEDFYDALSAKVETLDGGHDLTLEKPRETAEHVRAFISPT